VRARILLAGSLVVCAEACAPTVAHTVTGSLPATAPITTGPSGAPSDQPAWLATLPERIESVHTAVDAPSVLAGPVRVTVESPDRFSVELAAPVDAGELSDRWSWEAPFVACDTGVLELDEDAGGAAGADRIHELALPWMGDWEVLARSDTPLPCRSWQARDPHGQALTVTRLSFDRGRAAFLAGLPSRVVALTDPGQVGAIQAALPSGMSIDVDSDVSWVLFLGPGMDAAHLAKLFKWDDPGDLCGELVNGKHLTLETAWGTAKTTTENLPTFGRWSVQARLPRGRPCEDGANRDLTARAEAVTSVRFVVQ
jgi:hypothetical protein